ncbi:C-X-C motif chemokine 15-like [Arvicanthis niloticus]|uniref:C-X-C motif chemokine 15-like n=1 Tax=Arvicanthis niloticus TaxID=61156 RepID=UPI001486E872|nr:C-X-C motif chemokine 15-like [Arvicanthis niloticus]
MAASHWPMLLLAILNLDIFAHPCDTQELRCQCIKTKSEPIPLQFIKTIQVIFWNIYCNRMEVIATLKNGDLICLNPDAEWVKTLVRIITGRFLPEDHEQMKPPQEMKLLYSVEFEKPLYLSFVQPKD